MHLELLQTGVELLVGFIALLVMLKLLGKATLSQITPFDFISALILGDLIGNAIYDEQARVGSILFSVGIWGTLIYTLEMVTQKYRGTRKVLEGSPSIIVKDGQIVRKELKANKLDLDQLQHLLRRENVFSFREIQHAILETDGKVSVLKKSDYENPVSQDLQLPVKPVYLPITLISDGKVNWDNLQLAGYDESWLNKQLRSKNITTYSDVFFLEWKQDEGLYLEPM
ncbi:membrane protein [Bacillaceae bacterium JMAK1]|nr:membrane protein [Bacillaceae bacterium JMAK1]